MATQLATTDTRNEVASLNSQLATRAEQFKMVLPGHIQPEKFQRTIITAVQADPELLKADRQSLLLACMKAAQDGLLPDKREAALVIFSTRVKQGAQWVSIKQVQYMPMVYGLRKKILQSGEISSIETNVVYRAELESGAFIYEAGTEAVLRHRPDLTLTDEDVADDNVVAAYSVAVMKDGTRSFEVMRRSEINKVRQVSQTGALGRTKYNSNEVIQAKGPWVDWFSEMAKKSVMRRHSKVLPMSGDLVDMEGADEEIASRSTAKLLNGTEADAPRLVPPTREDVVADDAVHDPVTGEIEDEETIGRRLDAESDARRNDGTLADDNPSAADGPSEEQRGDEHDGTSPGSDLADEMIDSVNRAAIIGDVLAIEQRFTGGDRLKMEAVDQDRVETAIEQAKKRLKKAA